MRSFIRFALMALLIGFTSMLSAQSTGSVGSKENLDLPYDAGGGENSDEEAPPSIIFYGQQFEGDGIFYCLDRSGSTANGELAIEKRETIKNIAEFSDRVQFAVVFYDQDVIKWPTSGKPAEANAGFKSAAIGFITSTQNGSGTCQTKGLSACLAFADQSSAKRTQILFLTDGYTTCPGTDPNEYAKRSLGEVTAKNYKRHPINSICVGTDVSEFYPKTLAAMNGGTYKRVTR